MALVANVQMASPEQEIIPPSDSEDENYEPLPFPSDIDSDHLSEDSDQSTNPNNETDGPNSYGLQQTHIVNYSGDYEDQDDYFEGWTWNCFPGQHDSEPEYGPFLGKQQALFDTRNNEPVHFFNEMFSPSIFDEIADSTNWYATQRLNRTSEYNIYYLFINHKNI